MTYSQGDTKTSRDSLVYTPVRLMRYMVSELDECDSIRLVLENVSDQLYLCNKHNLHQTKYYQDSITKLKHELTVAQGFADVQTDNVNNAEGQLMSIEQSTDKFRKQRNAWRIIAGITIIMATIINVTND